MNTMNTNPPKLYKCLRCGYEWASRKKRRPIRCASCGSPYYNKPRRERQNVEP